MKKTKLILISLGILLLPVMTLSAQNIPSNIGNLSNIVSSIETAMWVVFMLIAVVCFIVAGILFLTAGGAPEKVQAARAAFIWGIAGVAVGIIAYSIVAVVAGILGSTI